ncbi:hydroxysqualene dehydroxylase HpnE [Pusillimonas sp. MFBS29]|uniref:hydroxysqualene dehydroxylase HpnE n=1 Tax=Pusillimonas sp. MFBS29 TaxID=2886690 RepID=UPI001D12C216|nr:hydroxysqualene dehydroxylase HpnE [Pusillimonas sp. MFBS29]MCC2596412.1 hydroxysqualene dehydroxylase HpnE [Pusillimonas sp. MFBS29]
MKIAVIGGGWAGLTAAWSLLQRGHAVALFEAGRSLGGRARRIHSRALDLATDNGQHILLGAYTETLDLMRELGLDTGRLFYRERLSLQAADGSFGLRTLPLPAPLHLLAGVLGAQGLTLKERLRLISLTTSLRRHGWKTAAGMTVGQWLEQGRQSPQVIRSFWQPLCLAALNTPVPDACAQLFAHVLRDSLGGPKDATDVLIPRVDLSKLWPDELLRRLNGQSSPGAGLHLGHAVRKLHACPSGIAVDGQHFDAAIVAGNVPSTSRLLAQLEAVPDSLPYLDMLSDFDFLPIATITLKLEHPWQLPQPMLLLHDHPARLQFGQWLFDRSALAARETTEAHLPAGHIAQTGTASLLHIVISDASALQEHKQDDVVAAVTAQVQAQTQRFGPMPRVTGHDVIVEKRATFAARPGLARPTVATPWPRVWVAGDWTDTGYPGVLEGAVRSGRQAAASLLRSLA